MNRIDRKTYYASLAKENDKTGATALTRDEIVQIAWDCGILMRSHQHQDEPTKIEQFAKRIAAAEREACAKVCDHIKNDIYNNSQEDTEPMAHAVANFCAAAIRARGEQEQPR